ncbi:PolC-type DNA polymerase III [Roseateles puraquae]|uniref:DNA-directed DNA polymerase n=1 Tax=Roseateles puraquae TaxID=431059 RepID=A0A254N6S4_9BURK|nr:3'-5' exonuclease [Roseateles puraquae]MDG0856722.1 3'-5' exonuclease [Roseateles puraquae]OWR03264.1 DNA polymerase III subunit epsilon [Roseateles puraquae]
METIAVVDFETTGLGPTSGGRATEIAAVLVRGGEVVDAWSSLMNSGAWVPPQIQALTGITNAMLAEAPDAAEVMRELARFTAGCPLVAHNAAFDRGFWQAEMARAGLAPDPAHQFACTVLLSRRLWPEAPSHGLGAMTRFHGLQLTGRAHRAMADARVTAQLLLKVQQEVAARFAMDLGDFSVDHALLAELQRTPLRWLRRGLVDHVKARQAGQPICC